jgi:hypothetical protein
VKHDPSKLRYADAKVGERVIIRHNVHNMRSQDILGTVTKVGNNWTDVYVRYFEYSAGDVDESGNRSGDYVVRKFLTLHLERPTLLECRSMALHYKRLTLDFRDLMHEMDPDKKAKKTGA